MLGTQVTATLNRGSKVSPEIGPQAVGVSPVLALVNVVPANQVPIATCRNITADADDLDTTQQDLNRICGVANSIGGATDVNNNSTDPDTAEYDTLATITSASYVRFLSSLASTQRSMLCPRLLLASLST